LHPFKIRDRHAAGIGKDVGQNRNAAPAQDFVGFRSRWAVGQFND
jgi:hypothetical protein